MARETPNEGRTTRPSWSQERRPWAEQARVFINSTVDAAEGARAHAARVRCLGRHLPHRFARMVAGPASDIQKYTRDKDMVTPSHMAAGVRFQNLDASYGWMLIPFWVFNRGTYRIDWANPAALRFWGAASIAELAARDFSDATAAARARIEKVHAAALAGVPLEESWTLYPLGLPKQVVLQSTIAIAADGSTDGILFAANNLKALPDSQLRGVQVLMYTPILVAFHSLDGAVLYRNPAAAKAWDAWRSDESSALRSLFAEPGVADLIVSAISEKHSFTGEFEMNTVLGIRVFSLDCRPALDPVDGSLAIELSATDITEYKAIENERDELRQKQVREAQAVAATEKYRSTVARKLFMATASHEMRTPLQTIIGCVDLLEKAPEELGQSLPELRDAADQLSGISQDLVEFVRADSAPGVRLRDVHGADFLQRTLAPSLKRAEAKGLRFTITMSGLDLMIRLDETRSRQILSNLAGNAVAYTLRGEVTIAAKLERTSTGSEALLTALISDTGVGMPEGTAQNVLQPFVRGRDSAQIDPQGLGMGLAIVQSHLTELGGALSIESAPDVGTKISVTIPCSIVNPAGEAGVLI